MEWGSNLILCWDPCTVSGLGVWTGQWAGGANSPRKALEFRERWVWITAWS